MCVGFRDVGKGIIIYDDLDFHRAKHPPGPRHSYTAHSASRPHPCAVGANMPRRDLRSLPCKSIDDTVGGCTQTSSYH